MVLVGGSYRVLEIFGLLFRIIMVVFNIEVCFFLVVEKGCSGRKCIFV